MRQVLMNIDGDWMQDLISFHWTRWHSVEVNDPKCLKMIKVIANNNNISNRDKLVSLQIAGLIESISDIEMAIGLILSIPRDGNEEGVVRPTNSGDAIWVKNQNRVITISHWTREGGEDEVAVVNL